MEIKNKKVFLRADFNVPIKNGVVNDVYRINSTLDTLRFLKDGNNKTLIVSHIETKNVEKPSLKPVFEYLQKNFPEFSITFSENIKDFENIRDGEFLLLENIRNYPGEKENSSDLAQVFRDITDIYINDAFAVSHRNHMSVCLLPSLYKKEDKMFGIQMQKEIDCLSKVLNPERPFAVILSGAKFSTKLPLIEKYLKTADNLFVGGALYNNILKSLGNNVGVSLVDNDAVYVDDMVKLEDFINKVFIPKKIIIKNIDTGEISIKSIKEIDEKETVQDIDNESIDEFVNIIKNKNTKTIVWNGPLGNYEDDNFKKGTQYLAQRLIEYIESSESRLFIGGGDTVAAINDMKIENERIFVSTGGGAMLEFLEKDGKLPGVMNVVI